MSEGQQDILPDDVEEEVPFQCGSTEDCIPELGCCAFD